MEYTNSVLPEKNDKSFYKRPTVSVKQTNMNDRIPQSPPVIAPVSGIIKRPRWSVMIPAYNCIRYLQYTLESVLIQDPGPEQMQIEVIDDCSTDGDVEALVTRIGKGRVGFYRQPVNRGSLRNFETCLQRATGEWVHILHGDDCILDGFYKEIESLFNEYPDAGAAFTNYHYINEAGNTIHKNEKLLDKPGIIDQWLIQLAKAQRIQPPAIVVKRSVYEHLGGFFAVHYGEDWEMWSRIAANYPMPHSPKYLAQYRVHQNNITGRSFLSGQNIADINKVIDIIQQYLPENQRAAVKKVAKKFHAIHFAKTSHKLYHEYQAPEAAVLQAWGAVKMSPSPITLYYASKLFLKKLIGYQKKEKKT
jgi:glycosyltransferase involved in cell wall biosynthesis